MIRLLADVLPIDPERERVIIREYYRDVTDSIDSIQNVVQQVNDNVTGSGGGHHSLPFILGGILAALVGLAFLIFMVRSYRQRGQQQLGYNRA